MHLRWFVLLSAVVAFLPAVEAKEPAPFAPMQDVLPVPAPADAIVLFDGKGTNRFVSMSGDAINWPIEKGCLVCTRGNNRSNHIVSTFHFRDADIHVEFQLPEGGTGNSGVYIHGHYELQIFGSFGKEGPLDQGDVGAIYGFAEPLVNAARDRGEWQVYDIRYRAPRRDGEGKIVELGSATAWLNGQKVQENTEFGEPRSVYHPFRYGTTDYLREIWQQQLKTSVGPVFLQDHDNAVRFRNVWVCPLDDRAKIYEPAASASEKP